MLPYAFALLVLLATVPTEEVWRVGRLSVGVAQAVRSFNGPHEGFAALGDGGLLIPLALNGGVRPQAGSRHGALLDGSVTVTSDLRGPRTGRLERARLAELYGAEL